MNQRGRKSTAELSVIPGRKDRSPSAPDNLTTSQKAIWRIIVKEKPDDWFRPDTHKLLVGYCRHVIYADEIAAKINTFNFDGLEDRSGIMVLDKLTAMHDREVRAAACLARAMRMTQQSQYDERTAKRKTDKTSSAAKLWDK